MEDKKSTRYYSARQEQDMAKKLGFSVQPNSGATRYAKGDIKSLDKNWLLEAKTCTTNKKTFAIAKEWLEKVRRESIGEGRYYTALAFNFGPKEPNYYIIDENLFGQLVEYLKED